jgi:DNA-binding MarR family transcriptional regulator
MVSLSLASRTSLFNIYLLGGCASLTERVGLGATETKTLFILSSQGALTAGEIAQFTGLTTSSVTSLIDRLESKGFVKRVRDTHDRRRVIVERNEERLSDLDQVFHSLQEKFMDSLPRTNNIFMNDSTFSMQRSNKSERTDLDVERSLRS